MVRVWGNGVSRVQLSVSMSVTCTRLTLQDTENTPETTHPRGIRIHKNHNPARSRKTRHRSVRSIPIGLLCASHLLGMLSYNQPRELAL